jgi:hypothetical protein
MRCDAASIKTRKWHTTRNAGGANAASIDLKRARASTASTRTRRKNPTLRQVGQEARYHVSPKQTAGQHVVAIQLIHTDGADPAVQWLIGTTAATTAPAPTRLRTGRQTVRSAPHPHGGNGARRIARRAATRTRRPCRPSTMIFTSFPAHRHIDDLRSRSAESQQAMRRAPDLVNRRYADHQAA